MASWHASLIAVAVTAGVPLVVLLLLNAAAALIHRFHRRRPYSMSGLPLHVSHWFAPFRLLAPAVALAAAAPLLPESATARSIVAHVAQLGIIAGVAWVATSTLAVARDAALVRLQLESPDNLRGRRIYTQFRVIERITDVAIVVIAVSFMLMTFSGVDKIGADLLASAGVVGVIVGIAAQRSLGTVLAGMQIAMSQPIRLDDVVVVEGEWGRIEEITLTYVVVHIWDHRRLILPVTYFIEKPFQNWTRTTSELIGTVSVYADYTVPVQPIRDRLQDTVSRSASWDHKVCALEVTNASEHTVELRAVVSADNSSKLWDLRCEVREHLIEFLQASYPDCLPRVRVDLGRPAANDEQGLSHLTDKHGVR